MIPWVLKEKKEGLFDLGDWLNKLPRPDRSGYLSVILSLAVAFSLATAVPYSDLDPRCLLRRVDCSDKETTEHAAKRTTWITFFPGGKGKQKVCTCHLDLQYNGQPIWHVRNSTEETCDSEHSVSTEWSSPPQTEISPIVGTNLDSSSIMIFGRDNIYEMDSTEGRYRLHCADSPNNAPPKILGISGSITINGTP